MGVCVCVCVRVCVCVCVRVCVCVCLSVSMSTLTLHSLPDKMCVQHCMHVTQACLSLKINHAVVSRVFVACDLYFHDAIGSKS